MERTVHSMLATPLRSPDGHVPSRDESRRVDLATGGDLGGPEVQADDDFASGVGDSHLVSVVPALAKSPLEIRSKLPC